MVVLVVWMVLVVVWVVVSVVVLVVWMVRVVVRWSRWRGWCNKEASYRPTSVSAASTIEPVSMWWMR